MTEIKIRALPDHIYDDPITLFEFLCNYSIVLNGNINLLLLTFKGLYSTLRNKYKYLLCIP